MYGWAWHAMSIESMSDSEESSLRQSNPYALGNHLCQLLKIPVGSVYCLNMRANSAIGWLQQKHGFARFLSHWHQATVVLEKC